MIAHCHHKLCFVAQVGTPPTRQVGEMLTACSVSPTGGSDKAPSQAGGFPRGRGCISCTRPAVVQEEGIKAAHWPGPFFGGVAFAVGLRLSSSLECAASSMARLLSCRVRGHMLVRAGCPVLITSFFGVSGCNSVALAWFGNGCQGRVSARRGLVKLAAVLAVSLPFPCLLSR